MDILFPLFLCQHCPEQWGIPRGLSHGVKLQHLAHGAKDMGVFQPD